MTPSDERALLGKMKKIVDDVVATREKVDGDQDERIAKLEKAVETFGEDIKALRFQEPAFSNSKPKTPKKREK